MGYQDIVDANGSHLPQRLYQQAWALLLYVDWCGAPARECLEYIAEVLNYTGLSMLRFNDQRAGLPRRWYDDVRYYGWRYWEDVAARLMERYEGLMASVIDE